MYLFKLIIVLVLAISIDGHKDVHWIEDGAICSREYGPHDRCIHYSNCAEKYGCVTKGHAKFCYFSGIHEIFCCVENDEAEEDDSSEDTFPFPWKNTDYVKPPKKNEDYLHPESSHQLTKKPPQYESQQQRTQQSTPPPPQQPDDPVTTKQLPCYGVAFGTAAGGHNDQNGGQSGGQSALNGSITQNRIGLQCSKYVTAGAQQPLTTIARNGTRNILDKLKIAVVRGEDAAPLEFPHMAILGYGTDTDIEWHCGGTLISETFILTAAHCLETEYGNVAFVNLGVHALKSFTSSVQRFKVNNTYPHPAYDRDTRYHDIALIELDNVAKITPMGVKPARLHNSTEVPSQIFIATGWGATETDKYSDILQKVNLTYVPHTNCTQTYRPQGQFLKQGLVDSWQLCAGGGSSGRDTCGGDSGGPLQIKSTNDTYILVGITSFGKTQCGPVPAIYTRVSNYVPWIEGFLQQ